jgi:hypothetical protein
MSKYKNMLNMIGFQTSWWACVLGAKNGHPYLGPVFMFIFLLFHFSILKNKNKELIFIILVGLIGTIADTILFQTNLIEYQGVYIDKVAPLWITAMWMGFAATINHSLVWLNNKWIISFVIGAIFGPLSYFTGIKFEALYFEISLLTMSVLALLWGVVVPSLYYLNGKVVINK